MYYKGGGFQVHYPQPNSIRLQIERHPRRYRKHPVLHIRD